MPQACRVCGHPDRARLEEQLLAGIPLRQIAKTAGLAKDGLKRHRENHLPELMVKAAEARDAARGGELLQRLESVIGETQAILREARASKNHNVALKAIARAESQIELQARLLGQIRDTKLNVNLNFSEEAAERVAAAWLARRPERVIDTTAR